MRFAAILLVLFVATVNLAHTQQASSQQASSQQASSQQAAKPDSGSSTQPAHPQEDPLADAQPVTTHHQLTVGGKALKYTATAGRISIKPENGPTEAAIFFTAYTLDGEDARTRPVTFVFNGGPGTSTA